MYLRKPVTVVLLSLLAALWLAPAAMGQTTLSSPVAQLYQKIRNTIGQDDFIALDPLNENIDPVVITIRTLDRSGQNAQAAGLAAIVISQHVLGNVTVNVRVLDPDGNVVQPTDPVSPFEATNAYIAALSSNR